MSNKKHYCTCKDRGYPAFNCHCLQCGVPILGFNLRDVSRRKVHKSCWTSYQYETTGKPWYENNKERVKTQRKEYSKKYREQNREKRLWIGAKNRATQQNLEFNIDVSDIVIPKVCPILKTKFKFGTSSAASLDRIDPSKGYVKGNIQVISRKANLMKNNATVKELKDFAEWVKNQYN